MPRSLLRAVGAQPHGQTHFPLTENSSSDQRQACKKHELYVSFRDLGWQVRAALAHHLSGQHWDLATGFFYFKS